jgi:pimeloyl-ACP methyl ester carboxylesterase
MVLSFENRELFCLDLGQLQIRGTYHKPIASRDSVARHSKPLGLVFWNSFSLPRSATGNSAAFWADAFACQGYPSFRIDLPGLGDSPGELPLNLLDFINVGGFAESAARSLRELVTRFSLSGVVVVGHCAGGVTAIYSAAQCGECKGLVLMDQYFNLPLAVRPKIRRLLSDWALHNRFGSFASNIYDWTREFWLYLRGDSLPPNANHALLRAWKNVAAGGMPILLLKAPARKALGMNPRTGEFDYIAHAIKAAGPRGQVMVRLIEGTEHSFANRHGREAVRLEIGSWLEAAFPLARGHIVDSKGQPTTMPFNQSPAACEVAR